MIRTYAIFQRNRWMKIFLCLLMVVRRRSLLSHSAPRRSTCNAWRRTLGLNIIQSAALTQYSPVQLVVVPGCVVVELELQSLHCEFSPTMCQSLTHLTIPDLRRRIPGESAIFWLQSYTTAICHYFCGVRTCAVL